MDLEFSMIKTVSDGLGNGLLMSYKNKSKKEIEMLSLWHKTHFPEQLCSSEVIKPF